MGNIPPITMVMTGGWFIVLPTLSLLATIQLPFQEPICWSYLPDIRSMYPLVNAYITTERATIF